MIKLLQSIITLFLLASTAAFSSCPDTACTGLTTIFNKHFREGNNVAAAAIFKNILASCPSPERALLHRGVKVFEKLCADTLYYNQLHCRDSIIMVYAMLHLTEPSGSSAMHLATLYGEAGDHDQASRYFREAIDLESDPLIKAEICMSMAHHAAYQLHDLENARLHARRSLVFNPMTGKPYIFIGKLYAASADTCKMSIFKGKSAFWAATDQFELARADTGTKAEAEELIIRYSKLFPSGEEIKNAGMKPGETFRDKCWIRTSSTIRAAR